MSETQEAVTEQTPQAAAPKSEYEQKRELKHQSYVELKRDLSVLANIVGEQKRLIQSAHVLLKNYLARQEAVVELMIKKGVCTQGEMDELVDANLGLRERAPTEELKAGDVAWVNYTAVIEGTEKKYEDKELPVRVGSNTVIFDGALIGRKISDGTLELRYPLTKGEDAGKEVRYTIEILKAKVKVGSGTQTEEKTDEPAQAEPQN